MHSLVTRGLVTRARCSRRRDAFIIAGAGIAHTLSDLRLSASQPCSLAQVSSCHIAYLQLGSECDATGYLMRSSSQRGYDGKKSWGAVSVPALTSIVVARLRCCVGPLSQRLHCCQLRDTCCCLHACSTQPDPGYRRVPGTVAPVAFLGHAHDAREPRRSDLVVG